MSPIYDHLCEKCEKRLEFFRVMEDASRQETCPLCHAKTRRLYTFQKQKEFKSFYDPLYKTESRSRSQEDKLMKKHGHTDASDVQSKCIKEKIKESKYNRKLKNKERILV